jgi:micrococcal nuclease
MLAAAVLALGVGNATAEEFPGPYYGEVIRVIDGDTFEAKVEIWPSLSSTVSVRLKGIDAPELRRWKCEQEKLDADDAKAKMEEILPVGTRVRLEDVESDSFAGRVVAEVLRQGDERGRTLIELLLNREAAVCPWMPSQPDVDWCSQPYPRCWG